MGHLNSSCLISKDLIRNRDRIVAFVIHATDIEYRTHSIIKSQDNYQFASINIRGTYNDYANIDIDTDENYKLEI